MIYAIVAALLVALFVCSMTLVSRVTRLDKLEREFFAYRMSDASNHEIAHRYHEGLRRILALETPNAAHAARKMASIARETLGA
jgi:hypothetical protein